MDKLIERLDLVMLINRTVSYIPDLIAAVVIMTLFWLAFRLTRVPLRRVLTRTGLHQTLISMLVDNVYRLIVLIFGLVMAADQIGINVAAALAGIGVAGIAVGFAAQDTLANIIAGFLIFIDRPFQVGHWVTVTDHYGEVVNITMRSTRIRTKRNTFVVIPNKAIIDSVLENHSKDGVTRIDVPVGIAYKENISLARKVILAAVSRVEGISSKPQPDVVVTGLGDSSINLNVRVWIDDAADEQPVYSRILEACKLALDEAGIEIPYPHLQLFIENVEDRVWEKAGALPTRLLRPPV